MLDITQSLRYKKHLAIHTLKPDNINAHLLLSRKR